MARKRQIDPDIWTSEQFTNLKDFRARLLFIGCFSNADDEGRLKAGPAYLKMIIFPGDPLTTLEVRGLRDMVEAEGLIQVYSNGQHPGEYLSLPTFSKHQMINKRYPSKLPPPPTALLPYNDGSATAPLPYNDGIREVPLRGKSGVGLGSESDLKSKSDLVSVSDSESGTERPGVVHKVINEFVDNSPRPTDPTIGKPTLDKEKDTDDAEPDDEYIKRLHKEYFGELIPTPKTIPKIGAAITGISQFSDDDIVTAFKKAAKQHPPPKYPLAYVLKTLQDKNRKG